MAEQVTLTVQRREVLGKKVRRLRREGIIPGNIFGRGRASVPIQLDATEFSRFLKAHAPTTIVRLSMGRGAGDTAVVRHVQHEPATGAIQHVDFLHIEMSEPIRARVPIRIEGEAPAVKLNDGILLHLLDAIEVEALPANLPQAVTLDVSPLAEVNQSLKVSDLRVPDRVTVVTDAAEPVVKIDRPRIVVEITQQPAEAPAEEAPAPEEGTATPETTS
jgi:large subunit ribosomal protein L25